MPPALEARGVTARYPRAKDPSLQDLDLTLSPGEVLATLGPNGAGKSTLLRVLAGILSPVQGQVLLDGTDIASLDRREIARRVAVVPQSVQVAFGFTVREVVMMGRSPHQRGLLLSTPQDRAIVAQTLELTDLEQLAERPVSSLSGGEQKRVAIARALAQQPRILLLDEATAHLDIRHAVTLHALIRREVKDRQLACLAIMHDLNEAAQNASRVVLLDKGKLRAVGSIAEVMTYRILRETFGVDLYVGVNEVDGTTFGVNLIPHTMKVTTWGDVKVGSKINIEIDMLARYLARLKEFA